MAARFLKIFFATLAGGLILVALINFTVDPYASFRWTEKRGFNDQKRLKTGGGRVNKSVILGKYAFDTIALGTSTVETGIDPQGSILRDANAYNAAFPSSNIYELAKIGHYIAERQQPKHVVIGLDFAAFGTQRAGGGDYADSGFAGHEMATITLQRLLSMQSLSDSVGTVRDSSRRKASMFSKYGNYAPQNGAGRTDFHQQLVSSLDTYLTTYSTFRYDRQNLTLLQGAVAALTGKGVQVVLFISPLHALHLDAVELAGLQPTYDQWKRDLARLAGQANVALWDFSYSNSITLDPVPSEPGGTMQWYWDSVHYNAAAGDLMLCRMLGCSEPAVPEDFGMKLTVPDIDAVLLKQQNASSRNLAAFSPELARKARSIAGP